MELILDFAKRLLLNHLHEAGVYADFTMGNGYDTLFLAQHTKGTVYSFDIQQTALEHTQALLEEHRVQNARLILDSHSHLTQYITEPLDAGIFNLGYLPGGDKSITTQTSTTLQAVQDALALLKSDGILVLVLYPGHPQGKQESEVVSWFCAELDGSAYDVIRYDFINKKNPPYVIAIEKRTAQKARTTL